MSFQLWIIIGCLMLPILSQPILSQSKPILAQTKSSKPSKSNLAQSKLMQSPFCQNGTWISGAQTINSGFNAKTGEFSGLAIWKRSPASDMYHPEGDPNCFYIVPKEVGLVNLALSQESVVQSVVAHYEQYLKIYLSYYSFEIGFEGSAFSAAFQYSKEVADVYFHLAASLAVQGFSEHWWKMYRLTSLSAWMLTLDDLFAIGMNHLPPNIQTTDDHFKYEQFVRSWGTHTPVTVDYGASIRIYEYLDQSFVANYTLHKVIEQMGLVFYLDMFDISSGGYINKTEIEAKLEQLFLHHLNRSTFFSGGAPILQSNMTLKEWVTSIPYFTTPQNMTLRSLSEFMDSSRAKTFSLFVKEYLTPSQDHNSNFNSQTRDKHQILAASFYLGHGVDVTSGMDALLPWFDFTFGLGKIWQSIGGTFNSLVYPDQLTIIPRTQLVWANLTAVIQNGSDYQSLVSQYSSSGGWFGIDSSSEQSVHFLEQFYLQNNNLSISELTISYGKAMLPILPLPSLSPIFSYAIRNLPREELSEQNWPLWTQFFKIFGIGFIDQAEVGGKISLHAWTMNCFSKNKSFDYYQKMSSWFFVGILGDGSGHVDIDVRVSQDYISMTKRDIQWHGGTGQGTDLGPSGWRIWSDSIPLNMIPVVYSWVRLDTLLHVLGDIPLANRATQAIKRYFNESQNSFSETELKFKNRQRLPIC